MTVVQYFQILIEDVLPVTSHMQTFLLIVILPPLSPCHTSDRPYLVATCNLYEPWDIMSDELKVRLLGLSNSEKCTCLVIFSEAVIKLRGQVVFWTRRWPNYYHTDLLLSNTASRDCLHDICSVMQFTTAHSSNSVCPVLPSWSRKHSFCRAKHK